MIQQGMNEQRELEPDIMENEIEKSKEIMGVNNNTDGFMPRREV